MNEALLWRAFPMNCAIGASICWLLYRVMLPCVTLVYIRCWTRRHGDIAIAGDEKSEFYWTCFGVSSIAEWSVGCRIREPGCWMG